MFQRETAIGSLAGSTVVRRRERAQVILSLRGN